MSKMLSIIIPVYNGESYIEKCIDSILAQSSVKLGSLELLIINDGSTDNSLNALEKYKKNHPDIIRVIDQKNKGAAYTRNKGIKLATGRYTTFIDQDDWIDFDFCEVLMSTMEAKDCDVLQSGFKLVTESGLTTKTVMPINTEFGRLLAIPAWAKIYKTKFLIDNNIRFFENNIGEDSLFTLRVVQLASLYETINYAGYNNYFENKRNVTNSLHKGLSQRVNILNLLDVMADITAQDSDSQQLLDYNILRTCVYYLLLYGRYASSKRFIEVYCELFGWLRKNLPNIKTNRFVWKKPRGEYISASIGIKLMVTLDSLHATHLFASVYCRRDK